MDQTTTKEAAITEIRFTICPRCGDRITLAVLADPEDDVVRWKQHICTQRWRLALVRTRA